MKLPWEKPIIAHGKNPNTIRVVTFNVHFAKNPLAVAEAIYHNHNLREADIFLFQEIESHHHELISRAEAIATALGLHHVYAPAREIGTSGTHGLAILSKQKLRDTKTIKLPFYKLMTRSRPRIAMLGTATIAGHQLHICNVHLDTTLNFPRRIEQIGFMVQQLLQIPHGKIILGGDFNTVPISTVGNTIPISFANQKKKLHQYLDMQGFTTTTERVGYTLSRGLARFQLDGIYTKNLKIINSGVERSVKVSDHKPLWIDVVIK